MIKISITMNNACDRPRLTHGMIKDYLLSHYGGYTEIECKGAWQGHGRIYRDNNTIYESITEERYYNVDDFKLFIYELKGISKEEGIMVTIEDIREVIVY